MERAELLRRRRRGRDRGDGRRARRLLDGAARQRRRRTSSTAPTRCYGPHPGSSSATCSEVSDLHLATIEALALAIDAKDQTAQSHIRRVQVYAAGLARALGMTDNEIQGVKTAALLHDIGKLAVPEHILSKPGPLTQEEFQKIRIHPQVGAEIISGVPFPYPVAPLILSHHERWDGKGYPAGLKGEEMPLGARILLGRGLLRRADVRAVRTQGDEPRGGDRACCGRRAGQGARSARRADVHRHVSVAGRGGGSEPGSRRAS